MYSILSQVSAFTTFCLIFDDIAQILLCPNYIHLFKNDKKITDYLFRNALSTASGFNSITKYKKSTENLHCKKKVFKVQ